MPALHTARRAISAILLVIGMLGLFAPTVLGQDSGGPVYIATINSVIDLGMTPYVKRTLSTATEERAQAVILDINTPGGRLDAALSIKDALLDAEVPLIAYVNREAFSAGALIAISANKIYMDEGGVIGRGHARRPGRRKRIGEGGVRRPERLPRRRRGPRPGPTHRRGNGGQQRGHRRPGGGGQAPHHDHERGHPMGLRGWRGDQHRGGARS